MKKNANKLTVLLAVALSIVACSQTKDSSKDNKSSGDPVTTTSATDTSKDNTSQADSSEEKSSSSQEQSSQEQSSSQQQSSQEESSSQQQSSQEESSSQQQSSEEQSSSSENTSSEEEAFKYDSYLLKHSGANAEYVFEAECTNLTTKEGLGYSGTATESGMAVHDASGQNAFVTYLYKVGLSINYLVVCDRDINDGVLKARFGGEFMDVLLDPSSYSFRVDTIVTEEDLDEAIGNWDAAFLDYYTDLSETGGYYIDPWDCGQIHIDATDSMEPNHFSDFQITSTLRLKKGINCISLITTNSDSPGMGTMAAIAPVVDYISIKTSANLGMYDVCDNGEGTVGVHFKS